MDTPLLATTHTSEHHAGPHVWGSRFWTVLHTLSFTAAPRPAVVLLFLWQVLPELLPCGTCRLHHMLNMIQGGLHALAKVTTMSGLPVEAPERRFALIRHVCHMRAEVSRRNMLCEARVRERMSSFFKQATGLDIGGGTVTTRAWFADFTRKKDLIIAAGSRIPFSVYGRDLWFMLHIAAFVLPQDEGSLAHHHERGSAPPLPDYAGNRFRERMFAWFVQHVPVMLPPEHGGMAVRVLSLNLLRAQRDTGSRNLVAVQRHLSAAVEARLRRGESGAGCRTSSIMTLFKVHQILRNEYHFCGIGTGGVTGNTDQQQRLYALRSQGLFPSEAPVALYAYAVRKKVTAAFTMASARVFLWHQRMLKGRRQPVVISSLSITNQAQPFSSPYAGDPSIHTLYRIAPAFRYRRWTVLDHLEKYRETVFVSARNRNRLFVPRITTVTHGSVTVLTERARLCRALLLDSLLSLTGSIRAILLLPVSRVKASWSRDTFLAPLPPQCRRLLSRQIRRGIRLQWRDFVKREQRVRIGSGTGTEARLKHNTFSSSLPCWGLCMLHRLRVLKGLLEASTGPLYSDRSQNKSTTAFNFFLYSEQTHQEQQALKGPRTIDHGFHRWVAAVASGFSMVSVDESEVVNRRRLSLLHATEGDLAEVAEAWCTSDDAVSVREELQDGRLFDAPWHGLYEGHQRRRRVSRASAQGVVPPDWFEALPLHRRLRRVMERTENCHLPVSGCCAKTGSGKCSLPPSTRLYRDALASDEVWQRVPSSSGLLKIKPTSMSSRQRMTRGSHRNDTAPAPPSILQISPLCERHEHLRIFPLFASVCLEVAEDAFAVIGDTRAFCLSLVHSILQVGPRSRSICAQWLEPPPLALPAAETLVDSLAMARRLQEEMLVITAAVKLSATALLGFCLLRGQEPGFMLRFHSSREMRNFRRLSASAGGDGKGRYRLYMGFVLQSIWVRTMRNLQRMIPGVTECVVPLPSVAKAGRGERLSLDNVAGGGARGKEEIAGRRRVSSYVLRLLPDRSGDRASAGDTFTRTIYRLLFVDPHFSGNLVFDPSRPTDTAPLGSPSGGPVVGDKAGVLVWVHQGTGPPVRKVTDYSRIRIYGDPLHGAIGRVLQEEGITPDLSELAKELRLNRSVPLSMVLGWAVEAARRSVLREVAPFYSTPTGGAKGDARKGDPKKEERKKREEKGQIQYKDQKGKKEKRVRGSGSGDNVGSKDTKRIEAVAELLKGISSPFLLPQSTPIGRKVRRIGFGSKDARLSSREAGDLRQGIQKNIHVFSLQAALIDDPSSFLTDRVLVQDERSPDHFLPAHEKLTGKEIQRDLKHMYDVRFEGLKKKKNASYSKTVEPVGQFFIDPGRLGASILRWLNTAMRDDLDGPVRLLGPFFDNSLRQLHGFPFHCREELLTFLS